MRTMARSNFRRFALLVLFSAWLASAGGAAAAAAGKQILFIGRADAPGGSADDAVVAHLRALGNPVTEVGQAAGYADAVRRACGYDLVVISSSIRSRDFPVAFRDARVPLLTWENDLLDDLRFTGRYKDHDFGETDKEHYLWLVNAPHPLSGGRPAGTLAVYDRDAPMGWGKPGLGATIIATFPGQPDKAAIFGYERGATMDYDFVAPARRVFLPLGNDTFGKLNADGLALFDAAVRWSADGSHDACARP